MSDRVVKENLEPIDTDALLGRIVSVPISTWDCIEQGDAIHHVAPMAQNPNALLPSPRGEG